MSLIEIVGSVDELNQKKWNSIAKENHFLAPSFLKHFEKLDNNELKPLYILGEHYIIYGHLITIRGEKVANYFPTNKYFSLKKAFMSRLNFSFFCFGNTHLSNEQTILTIDNQPLCSNELNLIIEQIRQKFQVKFYLLPDHFVKAIRNIKDLGNNYTSIFTDPDMTLNVPTSWTSFEQYFDALSSKYKKRTRKIIKNSSTLSIKLLSKKEIQNQLKRLHLLYENVYEKSSFSGPKFDLKIFLDFIDDKKLNFSLFGFYFNEQLIGFSSEIINNTTLYSYLIGLDYSHNKKFTLYNRILYHTIENAIEKKASTIKFGRTAAEFKSTVGAEPVDSAAGVFISNNFYNKVFKPFVSRIQPPNWIQRKPFKETDG